MHMKNLMLMFGLLFMFSCGTDAPQSNDVKKNAEKEKHEQAAEAEKTDQTLKTECDLFLDDFEKWVVEIETTREKLNENKNDNKSTQILLQASQKLVDWANKWESLADCADDEKYEERMLDLEDRLNKAITL